MPPDRPSLRLRLLNLGLRGIAKPRLARTPGPAEARVDFHRAARWLFRAPPFLLHLSERGSPPLHWISAGPVAGSPVILYLHGGAYVTGSPWTHAGMLGRLSRLTGLAVVAPRYRLAPEHPAPAAFEDARAAHAALVARGHAPGDILLGGDSAGGGLALALLADLCARDLRPARVFALSPWTDLTLSGATLVTHARADPLLPASRLAEAVALIRGALDPDDPRLSPLFARFDRPPPVLIQAGSTEMLLDDSRRMAAHLAAAGAAVTLEVWPAAPHVWPIGDGYFPEARAALRRIGHFLKAAQPPAASVSR